MEMAKQVQTNARWCKGCGICVAFCPGSVLGLVKDRIRILNPEKCTKCGLCELRCPDYAIWLGDIPDYALQDGPEKEGNAHD
ncbi:MAG: 4Fe-4S binding protein [Clostridia bacterium]|nr:4Fe-4S binding protein [Clostridia bacterium]